MKTSQNLYKETDIKVLEAETVPNEIKQTDPHQDILQLKWENLKIENSKDSKKKRVIYKGIPIRNQNLWKPECVTWYIKSTGKKKKKRTSATYYKRNVKGASLSRKEK